MRGKTGAARVALATRCPVIPVATWGAQDMLPPYSKRLRLLPRTTMTVRAGTPVDLSDLYDEPVTGEVLTEATSRIMAALTHELEAIRGERAPATRFDPRSHGVTPIGKPRPLEEAS
jgi:1-acyl-sn-glycerol-3-phosphate acyltransferase